MSGHEDPSAMSISSIIIPSNPKPPAVILNREVSRLANW